MYANQIQSIYLNQIDKGRDINVAHLSYLTLFHFIYRYYLKKPYTLVPAYTMEMKVLCIFAVNTIFLPLKFKYNNGMRIAHPGLVRPDCCTHRAHIKSYKKDFSEKKCNFRAYVNFLPRLREVTIVCLEWIIKRVKCEPDFFTFVLNIPIGIRKYTWKDDLNGL